MTPPDHWFARHPRAAIAIGLLAALLLITFAWMLGALALLLGLLLWLWSLLISAVVGFFSLSWVAPLVATFSAWLAALWAWLASTWLGSTVLVPVYQSLFPIFAKVAPFITVGNGSRKLWQSYQNLRRNGYGRARKALKSLRRL